jgi:hypothetical protein
MMALTRHRTNKKNPYLDARTHYQEAAAHAAHHTMVHVRTHLNYIAGYNGRKRKEKEIEASKHTPTDKEQKAPTINSNNKKKQEKIKKEE